jgi:diphthine synthase
MGTLIFVGAGLGSIAYMSIAALEQLKSCDDVFIEEYTGFFEHGFAERLKDILGRQVLTLSRKEVEEGKRVLEAAEKGTVALLCAGDTMAATTHVSLRLQAAVSGIDTKVIYAPSILTAAPSALGLQHYKFGRTTTVPRFFPGYRPVSPAEIIAANFSSGLHTLVLLDTHNGWQPLSPQEALAELLEMSASSGLTVPGSETFVCILSRIGMSEQSIKSGKIGAMLNEDYGHPPHCIVVPAKLHFQEAEALCAFAGASKELMKEIM